MYHSHSLAMDTRVFLSLTMFSLVTYSLHSNRLTQKIVEQKPLKEFRRFWRGPSDFNYRDDKRNTLLMIATLHANKFDVLEYLLQSATHYTSDMIILLVTTIIINS